MPDRRPVDDLSIEELERVLAIKKRQARQGRLRRMKNAGRVIDTGTADANAAPQPAARETDPFAAAHSDSSGLPARTIELPQGSARKAKPRPDAPRFEDDIDHSSYRKQNPDAARIWRDFIDRSLLVLEVAAMIGLLVIGVGLFQSVGTLERETAEIQAQADAQIRASIPTIAPTPQLQLADIVLPGGHTPPIGPNGGQFNFEEIPVGLRAQVANEIFLPPEIERAPVTSETALQVIIPQIDVDHVIVQGVDWEALKSGVGQLQNGVNPADSDGNLVLAAHNDIFGEIFRHLDQLEVGMEFQVRTQSQVYTYIITGFDIVEPDAVHVMDPRGGATATLISCYPYRVNDKRYIIYADRVDI
jgi:sortase A